VCREWKVWELTLALHKPWYSTMAAAMLIIYNLVRLYLTWKVGPLRDDEERTFVTPARADYVGLRNAHFFFSAIFVVVLVNLALHWYDLFATASVWLPDAERIP
jgi:hypothetical protein